MAERDAIVEFLKTLRTARDDVKARFVDENFRPLHWRKFPYQAGKQND